MTRRAIRKMTSRTWSSARSGGATTSRTSGTRAKRSLNRTARCVLLTSSCSTRPGSLVSWETRRLEGTEGREEAGHARGARCGPRGQAATDELRAADGLLDQVEVRSLALTSGRAIGRAFSLRGAGAFLAATESSAKRTEPPLQEGIHC